MNSTKRTWIAAATGLGVAVVVLPLGAAAVAGTVASTDPYAAGVTDDELVEMREEERFAGDVYTALSARTGQQVFTRISASEDRHQSAVEGLLGARGVDVTELPNAAGDYAVDSFDTLYDQFLAQGSASRTAAYQVGVTIETTDIDDLTAVLARDLTPREEQVFGALLAGSRNHLAAFTALLDEDSSPRAGAPRQGQRQGMGQRQGPGAGWETGQHPRGHGTRAGTPGTGDCPYRAERSGPAPRR